MPSLPDIYQKVVAESKSETGTVAKVGELIAQDPAMMAKILQLANSAIFGLRSQVTSPAQAAVVIGMDTLKSLVLSMSVFKSFDNVKFSGFDLNDTVQHSLEVGALARHIAKTENLSNEIAGEAFTAGLLHDVGKLILASFAKEEFSAAIAKSKAERIPLVDAETKCLESAMMASEAYYSHFGDCLKALSKVSHSTTLPSIATEMKFLHLPSSTSPIIFQRASTNRINKAGSMTLSPTWGSPTESRFGQNHLTHRNLKE